MVTPSVRVRDLTVELGGHTVVDGIDLDVGSGEWLSIVGPNGAGKTTVLRAILGLVAAGGQVRLSGRDDLRAGERARSAALVPQSPVIPAGMIVADYVLLGRTPHRGLFRGDSPRDREVVTTTLERLDLAGLGGRELTSLSGGERQRAVLARALAQEAPILLLDEPTTALDLGHQQAVLELVEELRRSIGVTVVATVHDLTVAARFGDRVALLSKGRIVDQGKPADVLTAAAIAEIFEARVRVIDDPEGPVIVPVGPRSDDGASAGVSRR
jgi:iron complex transport system ATP-binding protein